MVFSEVNEVNAMSKHCFTKAQVVALRKNPYVYSVTPRRLAFTKEFKEIFFARYQSGALPRDIFKELGFDVNLISSHRIWSIAYNIRCEYTKYGCECQ